MKSELEFEIDGFTYRVEYEYTLDRYISEFRDIPRIEREVFVENVNMFKGKEKVFLTENVFKEVSEACLDHALATLANNAQNI